ncbi:MAG TPA: carbohydrate ABC transporter permease [Ktedonosporobacter sp.]|nr:carbohydrate ABC transporter permease [Ktedonosporobacter sp.]
MAQLQLNPSKQRFRASDLGNWLLNSVLVLLALFMLAPFLWVLVNALLPEQEALSLPPKWIPVPLTFENFTSVFELIPFWLLIFNSLKIALLTTAGALLVSVLAAYALARLRFPGRNLIFVTLLSSLMVPTQVTVIPIFILIRTLNLLDTHEAVYIPAFMNVFAIFFLRQIFLTIPTELEDAARIDGAGYLRRLFFLIVPLSKAALSSLAIFIFLTSWNDFFWPNLFLSSPEKMTLPVGLASLHNPYGAGAPPVVIFAAIALVLVPVLLLFSFAQRHITESFAKTGLKG